MDNQQDLQHFIKRFNLLFFLVFLLFISLIIRLAYLQLLHGKDFVAMAETNRTKEIKITAPRGLIRDVNGEVLVNNKTVFSVTFTESENFKQDFAKIAETLAPVLGLPKEEVLKKMDVGKIRKYPSYLPRRLKVNVTPEIMAFIEEHKSELPGVELIAEQTRNYIYDKFLAQVLGYTRPITQEIADYYRTLGYNLQDRVGMRGLEKQYESYLHGKDGKELVEVNNQYQFINKQQLKDPIPGNDLVLTIDKDYQMAVEKVIKENIEKMKLVSDTEKVSQATAVVLNPKTGEVLAMANYPQYDPNLFNEEIIEQDIYQNEILPYEKNLAVQEAFAPGSTIKPLTELIGLEEGVITKDTVIYDSGYMQIGNLKKYNYKHHAYGSLDLKTALQKSSNVFMFNIAMRIANYPASITQYKQEFATFDYYHQMFGLGVYTGIDLPEEIEHGWKSTYKELGNLADIAIGQYDTFTAIQLAQYVSTIANGGYRMKPYLVKEVREGSIATGTNKSLGKVLIENNPTVINQVDIKPEYIKLVQEGMRKVTEPGGTGYYTFLGLPFNVAAKTGTAEVGNSQNALMIGYAPYENPEIAFAVIVPYGKTGGESAGPIARGIVEAYWQIYKEKKVPNSLAKQEFPLP